MKNAILLLLLLFIQNFAFSQNSIAQNDYALAMNSSHQSVDDAFDQFEDAVFTQSDKKGIIASYISLGKTQSELGHAAEASSFFERAYVLAKEYYEAFPADGSLSAVYEYLNTTIGNFYAEPEKEGVTVAPALGKAALASPGFSNNTQNNGLYTTSLDSVDQLIWAILNDPANRQLDSVKIPGRPSLEVANNTFAYRGNTTINTSPRYQDLPEQKILAACFDAITEPADYGAFTVTKKTSLRQKATHKSPALQRLPAGTELVVLEMTNKYWWKIRLGSTIGYVKALLLE